jgi:NDP-sugar pyrophosphorylase family protein
MRAVVLAGGVGARLAPYTVALPKPLMPLGSNPVLEIIVRQLRRQGFERVTMAVGHLGEVLQAFFGDGAKYGLTIDYSREERPLGTAGPLRRIADLEEDFLVVNGDILTDLDFRMVLERHRQQGNDATIAVCEKEVRIGLGVLQRDPEGRIVRYDEKPTFRYEVSMGVYALSRGVVPLISADYCDFPDLVLELIRRGRRIRAFGFEGVWLDLGRPEDYAKAVEAFEKEPGRFLEG